MPVPLLSSHKLESDLSKMVHNHGMGPSLTNPGPVSQSETLADQRLVMMEKYQGHCVLRVGAGSWGPLF